MFFLTTWHEGSRWNQFKTALASYRMMRKENVDIVHLHVAQKGSFFRKALFLLGSRKDTPIVLHMHASSFDKFYNGSSKWVQKWIRRIFDKATCVVVLSEEWESFYKKLTKTEIKIIPNAVPIPDESYYNPSATKIITFGRIGKRKGSYDILEVAKRIKVKYPQYQFVLFGDGEVDQMKKRIEEEQIENVTIGGWVTDKEEIMKDAVLHFLPSYHEGLPMAILETMAAGIPNMASTVGGISQLVKSKENGMLIEAGNIEMMVSELEQYLSNEDSRAILSENARKTVIEKFSMDSYNSTWYKEYQMLEKIEKVCDTNGSKV
ncbi:glycosyltransferase [Listeria fleischmannii]|nr:glycosyltransferase [Listeria fleischmannii]EMG28811.1 glycosytransferase [Listeria fleischmannii subsp. fleischmannii LU2006-1]